MKKFVCTVCDSRALRRLLRQNVRSVMHRLRSSKSRQVKESGLQSTL